MISAARLPGVGVEGRRGVLAGGRVLEHLAARGRHQRVDPHHVALVAGAGDVDGRAGLLGGIDDLVPRHRLVGGIEARLLGDRLAVPEQLRVGPERGGDELVVPGRRRDRAVEHVVGQGRGLVVGERPEEVRLRELGHEHRVEAHEVDRAVVGRQAPHELLALAVGVPGEHRDLDAVGAVGRLGALLRELLLAAVVGVRVPGQRRCAAVVAPATGEDGAGQEPQRHGDRGTVVSSPSPPADWCDDWHGPSFGTSRSGKPYRD